MNKILHCFELPLSLLQTPGGLSESVRLVADKIKSQGVIYAEFRFAPQLHTNKGMTQEDAIKAALEGIKRTSLKVNLILCLMRGNNNSKENNETVELARKYLVKDGGVVAIDLAGVEGLYPTSDFEDVFAKAKEYGIPFTIHAGEAAGPESIRNAIDLGAKRIGHGISAIESPEIVEILKQKKIPLEMCPSSNIQTNNFNNIANYPFMDFLQKGIKVTINSDDMAILRTSIANEFNYMEQNFNLTYDQEKIILLNSVDAAFTTDEVKAHLRAELGF